MPLVLSLRQGDDFYVGKRRVEVWACTGRVKFQLKLDNGVVFNVSDEESIEILDDVFVSAGNRAGRPQHGIACVSIDAPREISIVRGDRYREAAQ
jgi:hypothetical protein